MTKRWHSAKQKDTSWEGVGGWYNDLVGQKGHYYHSQVVLPGVLKLLNIPKDGDSAVLDLACGQGVLARQLPDNVHYTGVEISPMLVKAAKAEEKHPRREFIVGDASKPLNLKKKHYSHAAIILALQNIEHGCGAIENAACHLREAGKLAIVLNHPCFRIPRQSSWQVDEAKKMQYRRVDRYHTEMSIPIQAHPGKKEHSPTTWSFHTPLSTYFLWLQNAGFKILMLEEWYSDKMSIGKKGKMENRSREEIPLFLTILAEAGA